MKFHKASCRCRRCRGERSWKQPSPTLESKEILSGGQVLLVRQQTKTRKEITKEAVRRWRERQKQELKQAGIIHEAGGVAIRTCYACGEGIAEITKYEGGRKIVTFEHTKDFYGLSARREQEDRRGKHKRAALENKEKFPGAPRFEEEILRLAPEILETIRSSPMGRLMAQKIS